MATKTLLYVGAESSGLFRKDIEDDHWEMLTEGMPPRPLVPTIAVHPDDHRVILIGTQRGVYRTIDGGDHWKRMDMAEGRIVRSLRISQHDHNVMYAGTEGSEIFRSDDGGDSWKYLSNIDISKSHQMAFATRVMGMAIDDSDPNVMYAGMEVGGVARSLDAGNSWEVMNHQFAKNMGLLDGHGVAFSSSQSDAVYYPNRTGVWRSRDRMETWENLHMEAYAEIFYCRGVFVAPNDPSTLYACLGANINSPQGAVFRSADSGDTWHRFDQVNAKSTAFSLSANPARPEQIYFCTREGEVYGTDDGGESWNQQASIPQPVNMVFTIACVSV